MSDCEVLGGDDGLPVALRDQIRRAAGCPRVALEAAPAVREELGLQTPGNAFRLWRGLARIGAIDLTVARTLEPHLDALAILAQAAEDGSRVSAPEQSTWGVFAAEGPGERLRAERDEAGEWVLTGTKPWCSLAGVLTHALITAWTSEHGRTLFAVRLDERGVEVGTDAWVARGLSDVRTVSLRFDRAPALAVGAEDWYLRRPGFALGGVGVAAIWWGAAATLGERLQRSCAAGSADQLARYHLGRCDTALFSARAVLDDAARAADRGALVGEALGWPEALRIRSIVHDACEIVLAAVSHALGPAPLTGDEEHSRRVADLQVYLRQHKAERDLAAVGAGVLEGMPAAWARR